METARSPGVAWPCRWCHQQGPNARSHFGAVGVGGDNSPPLLTQSQSVYTRQETTAQQQAQVIRSKKLPHPTRGE